MATLEIVPGNMFSNPIGTPLTKYLPRIVRCLELLSEEDVWWRPNPASNAAGNLVLHLSGNVRQWIISGLGGEADIRERDKEFAERPISKRILIDTLSGTVDRAREVIHGLAPEALAREFDIQGYKVSGLDAIASVYE